MDKGRLERRYNLFKERSKFHNNELCDNFIGSVTKANGAEFNHFGGLIGFWDEGDVGFVYFDHGQIGVQHT